MSAEAEFKICQLNKGKTIKQVLYRLELMEAYIAQKQCLQRIRLANLPIGD